MNKLELKNALLSELKDFELVELVLKIGDFEIYHLNKENLYKLYSWEFFDLLEDWKHGDTSVCDNYFHLDCKGRLITLSRKETYDIVIKNMDEVVTMIINNKNETIKYLNGLPRQHTKLIKIINGTQKKSKIWKPNDDEIYYYIHGDILKVAGACWHVFDDGIDDERHFLGNVFKTEKEAEFALIKAKVTAELKKFALENNTRKINWNNLNQKKWYITYNIKTKKLDIIPANIYKDNNIYFSSKKLANKAIEKISEYRLKKYYFGVEE